MDRHLHKKYYPQCPRRAGLVDQYMWEDKDSTPYQSFNGISHPVYDCKGWVNYSLPLEEYPPVDQVHPQIAMINRLHMNFRHDPHDRYVGRRRMAVPPLSSEGGSDRYDHAMAQHYPLPDEGMIASGVEGFTMNDGRMEGMYHRRGARSESYGRAARGGQIFPEGELVYVSDRRPGSTARLPSPYGDTRSCSACSGCSR